MERAVTLTQTDAEQNTATVRDFLEVFSAGNVPGVLDRLDDDATWWVSGKTEGFAGTKTKEEMGKLLESVVPVYKGGALKITPLRIVAAGDRVAVEAEGYAELTNGRVYNPQTSFFFRLANGKITEVREYLDTQHAYEIFFAE
jgi:ketosteroid isomerase-like protein